MKKGCIYKITAPNGRVYIGQTTLLQERKRRYRGCKMKSQKLLRDTLLKYGFDNCNFELLEDEIPKDKLNDLEIYWIDFHKSNFNRYPDMKGLNCTDGGEGTRGNKWTEEYRKKVEGRFAGEKNPNFGRKHTEEAIRLISESKKGKPAWFKGKNHTQETKDKISAIRKLQPSSRGRGYKNSPEARLKISLANSKIVIDISTGIYYNNANDAATALNINKNTLKGWLYGKGPNGKACNGKNRSNLIYA